MPEKKESPLNSCQVTFNNMPMPQKNIVLLVILVTFLTGCKGDGLFGDKKEWPCDKGQIKNMQFVQYGTLAPIEGAQVYLYSYAGSEETPSQIQLRTSDVNGRIEWPCEYAVTEICAEAEDCWDECGYGYDMNMTWVADGVYEMLPKAWAIITVVDDEPLNPDQLVFIGYVYGGSLPDPLWNGHTVIRECVGNRQDVLKFYVKEWIEEDYYNTIYQSSIDVLVQPLDTLTYVFHY
jgi:hypothetical protein